MGSHTHTGTHTDTHTRGADMYILARLDHSTSLDTCNEDTRGTAHVTFNNPPIGVSVARHPVNYSSLTIKPHFSFLI